MIIIGKLPPLVCYIQPPPIIVCKLGMNLTTVHYIFFVVKRVNYKDYSSTESLPSSDSEEMDIEAEYQYHRSRYFMFKRSLQKKTSQSLGLEGTQFLQFESVWHCVIITL